MPVGKTVKVGAWEHGHFIGAIIFARGASSNLLRPYGLRMDQGAELVRVALRTHITPVSRLVRVALRFLTQSAPGLRLVISFADTGQGHHGGIYQAGGWIYTGPTGVPTEYFYRGRWVHSMQIQTFMRQGLLSSRKGLPARAGWSKHRYLMPLDADMRAQITPLALPYPKRAGSIDGDALAHLAREGGSNPTSALAHG